ncbi:MAG: flavodoxin domain-containing protein [Syntrophobacteraceae bacterium]
MAKAIVVYATRTNQTKEIANLISEGLRFKGVDVTTVNINDVEKQGLDLSTFDAVVLGAATYHGEMLQTMKTFLFGLEKLNLEGKAGGAFGAFGWSGEAPGRIFDTMQHVYKMSMANGPLRLKSASLGGGVKMAQDYGREIADKIA